MDSKELTKILDVCLRKQVKSIKTSEFEVSFQDNAQPQRRRRDKTAKEPPIETPGQYTDEQMLFWSSAGIPDDWTSN